jgi:peroxin-2
MEDGDGWTCLRCGEIVKECKPWSGDILEHPASSSTGKTVGFADGPPAVALIAEEEAVDAA